AQQAANAAAWFRRSRDIGGGRSAAWNRRNNGRVTTGKRPRRIGCQVSAQAASRGAQAIAATDAAGACEARATATRTIGSRSSPPLLSRGVPDRSKDGYTVGTSKKA